MVPWLKLFLGWRPRKVLIASFCLFAGLTVGLNALVSSLVIQEYLTTAESIRESPFLDVIHSIYKRMGLNALICILHAGVIDLPIARLISRPIDNSVKANGRLARGDVGVQVHAPGKGELDVPGRSFNDNDMVN